MQVDRSMQLCYATSTVVIVRHKPCTVERTEEKHALGTGSNGEFDSGTRGHRWPSRRQAVRPAARMTLALQ
jgi:hypothetical protein